MGFRLKWVFVALLVFVAGQSRRASGQLPNVRIGLLQRRESILFSGPAGLTIQALRGDRFVASTSPGETWEAWTDGRRVHLTSADGSRTWSLRPGLRLCPPEDGVVAVRGIGNHWDEIPDRAYRGVVEIRLGRFGSLAAVNVLDIETYLRGVVPSEMPAYYPVDALRAQAVAARGQVFIKAGRHRAARFDLCATQHCQVYGGATSEDVRTDRAVAETWGQVLEYDRRIADSLYSSNCGGHTVSNEDYWPAQAPCPYLRGGPDFDHEKVNLEFPLTRDRLRDYLKYAPRVNCNQPRYARTSTIRWWSIVPRAEMEDILFDTLGDFGELVDLQVTQRADSGIVQEITVTGTHAIYTIRDPARIRYELGDLNSASFSVEPIGEDGELPVAFLILGAGWGHQVGMCQVGAAGLADAEWEYRQILSKYYSGCKLVRRY